MIWSIVIGLIVGSVSGVISYFLLNKTETKNLPPLNFLDRKNQAMRGLQEKKEAYEKEALADSNEKIQSLLSSLNQRRIAAERECEVLDQQLTAKAAEHQAAMDRLQAQFQSDLVAHKQSWTEAELDAYNKIQKESQEKISEYVQERDRSLAMLQQEYDHKEKGMTEDFLAYSAEVSQKREALMAQIKEFEEKQSSIIERFKKDEEARQQADFYHIDLPVNSKRDVEQLKGLALQFSKPEVLYKLVYEVYYKAKMEELFKRVLGENKDKAGIYKITNIGNQKVYIGKTTKFLDRWRTHAKRGCGIERIKGQLYDAMFQEGLENFTWEIVEVCGKDDLTEREKYWTTFYKSEEWGYNMRQG